MYLSSQDQVRPQVGLLFIYLIPPCEKLSESCENEESTHDFRVRADRNIKKVAETELRLSFSTAIFVPCIKLIDFIQFPLDSGAPTMHILCRDAQFSVHLDLSFARFRGKRLSKGRVPKPKKIGGR